MGIRIADIVNGNYTVTITMTDPDADGAPMSCRVLSRFWRSHMHRIGDVIDDAEAEAIVDAARVCDGVEVGMRLLGYRDNSLRGLSKKLRERGFDREVADEAASELEAMGAIDEERQIERRGREFAERKLRGQRRVAADLCALGYERGRVEEWLSGCGIDFGAICARAIEKKGGVPERGDADGKRRLLSYLYRQGFSSEDIRRAVGIVNGENE